VRSPIVRLFIELATNLLILLLLSLSFFVVQRLTSYLYDTNDTPLIATVFKYTTSFGELLTVVLFLFATLGSVYRAFRATIFEAPEAPSRSDGEPHE
jgi:hypothetical protein